MEEDNNIIEQNITKTLELNYMPYAMSVIISRAIPEIDGFKPSHRKLLFTMYKMGLLNSGRVKSADVVGQTMKLNPHGDGAIYETLVRLTRGNGALLHPFIDSKGNFGKQYSRDMAYAASRYTEVKLDKICNEIFFNIDKNTVDFIDNYNGTTKEPVLFPTIYPNILVTPNQGIAVGMASSICSFNLKEVCNATIAYIKDENCNLKEYLLAPDFSTGGELLYSENDINGLYENGQGSIKVRCKYVYDKKNSCIDIYEIPYTTTLEVVIDKIIALVKNNKIREINDVRDETDLKGLKITIDIKRNVDPYLLMEKLLNMTPLLDNFICNFNVLIKGKPMTIGIKEILKHWLEFRKGCLKRQIEFDINKLNNKLHLLEGMSKILLNIDKAIKIIRETELEREVLPNLMEAFDIDNLQAEYISEIKLRNLNKEYLLNKVSELDAVNKDLEDLKITLNSDKLINKLIIKQLQNISKKYGVERKTDIIYNVEINTKIKDMFIEEYPISLFLTKENYFKKISIASLRSYSEQKLKSEDKIICQREENNKCDVLFFTSNYNVYKAKAYEFLDSKASSMGDYLPNVLELEENEKIIYMTATIDYKGYMLFAFENGKFAKVQLNSYSTKINRKKLINAFSNKSRLVFCTHISQDDNFIALSSNGKGIIFNTDLIPTKVTKNNVGIQVINIKKGHKLEEVIILEENQISEYNKYIVSKLPATPRNIIYNKKDN